MEYSEAKITHLIVEASGKPKTFVRTFATKPNKNLLTILGKLFGVIEIRSNHPRVPDLIDLIIDEVKNNYYSQKTFKPDQPLPNIADQFELALKKTNLAIASFLESEQIALDLSALHICIIVCHGSELHFSFVGGIAALLFYHSSKNTYRIIDISESNQVGLNALDPLKLFSQLVSGSMRPRDVLFVSSGNVLDYFSVERIKNILTTDSIAEGSDQLRQLIERINSRENFAAITVELGKVATPIKTEQVTASPTQEFDYVKAASRDSIRQLVNTERTTEKLLTPSALPEFKKYFSTLHGTVRNYFDKTKGSASGFFSKRKSVLTPKFAIQPQQKFNFFAEKIRHWPQRFQLFLAPLKRFGQYIKNLARLIPGSRRILGPLQARAQIIFNQFKQLPKNSQRWLVAAIVLLLIFGQSIIWVYYNNGREKKLEQFNQAIVDATRKKDDAESSLIYRDENQARQSLIDARTLITSLQPSSQAQRDQIQLLQNEINQQLGKLQHIVDIPDPIQIVNIQNYDPDASLAPLAFISHGLLIVENNHNQSMVKINVTKRVANEVKSNSLQDTFIAATSFDDVNTLLLSASGSVMNYNVTNDSIQKVALGLKAKHAIPDFAAFNNRVYVLDTTDNQIYRFNKLANSFSAATAWLKSDAGTIKDATAITLDGSVYLTKTDGTIVRFDNGNPSVFKPNVVDPALTSPNKIKATAKYLYVLDAINKRVVVFDKQGTLVNQYHSDVLADIKDFVVDEAAKKIYIVAGTTVYGIPTQHLK